MVDIEFLCDADGCLEADTVDVYTGDWDNDTPVKMYLPEGWTMPGGPSGLVTVRCPEHSIQRTDEEAE